MCLVFFIKHEVPTYWQGRSINSMSTLPWGASLDRLIAETPVKQGDYSMETRAAELRTLLMDWFAQESQDMKEPERESAILDKMRQWLMELQGCSFPPLRPDATTFAVLVMRWYETAGKVTAAAKSVDEQKEALNVKTSHAEAAVRSALSNIAMRAASTDPDARKQLVAGVASKMAAWKHSQLQPMEKQKELAEEQLKKSLQLLKQQALEVATAVQEDFKKAVPQTEEEIMKLLLEEVNAHMQELDLSTAAGTAAGTGETLDPTASAESSSQKPQPPNDGTAEPEKEATMGLNTQLKF